MVDGRSLVLDRSAMHDTIRARLRAGTRDAHERLERCMSVHDFARPTEYARFLQIQLSARRGIEAYFDAAEPIAGRPPSVTRLLEQDLDDLGTRTQIAFPPFPAQRRADHAAGVAWVVSGSSLGNRTMLNDLRTRADGRLPVRFLSDPSMPEYWKALLRAFEVEPPAADAAMAGARAAFVHFLDVATAAPEKVAA